MPKLPPVRRYVSDSGVRVYRIPCRALPNLSGRVYLLLGAGAPTLVDTGSRRRESVQDVLDGLESVRDQFGETISPGHIERILITHAHLDHFGGLPELVERTRARVGVHSLDRQMIEAYDERTGPYNTAFRHFLASAGIDRQRRTQILDAFGYVKGKVRAVPVDFTLHDGESLDGLTILHTPGHSPGHVCIAVGDILLTGDHVLARTLTQQWPQSVAPHTGLKHYLDSLEKVRLAGPFAQVLPGHELVIDDLAKRIDEIIASQTRRTERMLRIFRKAGRPLSVGEITERMYSRQQGFRAMLAMTDVGARVEYLDQRGQLAATDLDNMDDVENTDPPVRQYQLI